MKNIDFLPEKYREQTDVRRTKAWSLLVVMLFGGAIAAASLVQHAVKRQVQADLDAIAPQHSLAQTKNQKVAKLQQQLSRLHRQANLYTYLRHRWPVSRALAEISADVPEVISFREIRVVYEQFAAANGPSNAEENDPRARRRAARNKKTEEKDTRPPHQIDLEKFHHKYDRQRMVVYLTGRTYRHAEVHQFLLQLNQRPLIAKTELQELERTFASASADIAEFTAHVVLHPGFGQPGGPAEDSLLHRAVVSATITPAARQLAATPRHHHQETP